VELAIVMALAGLLTAVAFSGFRSFADSAAITGAARAVREHVTRARSTAIYRRERVRLRQSPTADLTLQDDRDSVLASLSLALTGPFAIDSVRVRPATLRFNSRGQAAPGSIYLYRERRGARIIVNFLGRVRVQRFSIP
jgi:Tfp pilus assembly protein FimT